METHISVSARARPDSQEFQSCRKFDLKLSVDIEGGKELADLSDAEVYSLIFPRALNEVRNALNGVAANARARLNRVVPHDQPFIKLGGDADVLSSGSGPFRQHHEIDGHMIVDAHTAVDAGESWFLGLPALTETAAHNIVTNVLRGLGRETVEINPAMMNGTHGIQIDTYRASKRNHSSP